MECIPIPTSIANGHKDIHRSSTYGSQTSPIQTVKLVPQLMKSPGTIRGNTRGLPPSSPLPHNNSLRSPKICPSPNSLAVCPQQLRWQGGDSGDTGGVKSPSKLGTTSNYPF